MQILKEAYLYSIQIYKNICGNGQKYTHFEETQNA